MKNFEGFRASVYARAEVRRAEIRERNRKIRGAALSAAMIALVMSVMVPVVRNGSIFVGLKGTTTASEIIETQVHGNTSRGKPGEAPPARMVLLMGTPDGGAAEVLVLDSDAGQKALADKYGEPLLTPALDLAQAPQTLHSTEELEAFLQSLPKTGDSMQQVISEYDEEFFASNDLCAMPLDVMPAGMGVEETLPEITETETEPGTELVTETRPVTETGITETEPGMTQAETQSRPPPPSDPTEGMLGENDVQVLFLVPTNKTQREAITEIPS